LPVFILKPHNWFFFVPVVGAGDQNLFTSIYPTLSQQLPREPMEWRRYRLCVLAGLVL
jgi:hypothetical protein